MAMDMFVKFGDVKGESKDDSHADEISILSWQWGATQAGTAGSGTGGGSGKAQITDLTFTKNVDRSSPVLMAMCCKGTHVKDTVLTVRKAGDKPLEYVKIKLEEAMVTSVTLGGDGGSDRITETVSLNFSLFHFEYVPQKADGTGDAAVTKGFDIAKNIEL